MARPWDGLHFTAVPPKAVQVLCQGHKLSLVKLLWKGFWSPGPAGGSASPSWLRLPWANAPEEWPPLPGSWCLGPVLLGVWGLSPDPQGTPHLHRRVLPG